MFILLRALFTIATILCAAVLSTSFCRKHRGKQWYCLSALLWTTFLVESIALLGNIIFRDNLLIYAVGLPFITVFTFLYFNYSNPLLLRGNIGLYFAAAVIIIHIGMHMGAVLNWKAYNTQYVVVETILEIMMGFAYFLYLLKSDEYIPLKEDPHFWVAALVVFVNGGTFFQWIITEFMKISPESKPTLTKVYNVIALLAMGYYLGFCCIFYCFKNKTLAHER